MFSLADMTRVCFETLSASSLQEKLTKSKLPLVFLFLSPPSHTRSLVPCQLTAALVEVKREALHFASLCGQIHLCHSLSKIVTMQQLPQ